MGINGPADLRAVTARFKRLGFLDPAYSARKASELWELATRAAHLATTDTRYAYVHDPHLEWCCDRLVCFMPRGTVGV